jgi:hypothetical protein
MVRRLGKERNTCALIGDLNGRLTDSKPGAGPVTLDLMCGKGWIPFLHTAARGTKLHPIRTFWRNTGSRTCPDHAFIYSTSEQILTPSEAYVLDGLSDGHHILGVAFQVADGLILESMKVPKQHHTHKRKASGRPRTPKDLDRYQALLSQWFREEPTLEYDSLAGEEAEQTLQDLMDATIEIGLQQPHLGRKFKTGGIPHYWHYMHTCSS